jgi:Aspartate ammonia-lyase
MRVEHDFLGDKDIPSDALYGIHAVRAVENFPDNTRFHAEWYRAVGLTKLACYLTYQSFKKATIESYSSNKIPFPLMDDKVVEALIAAAEEVSEGKHFEHFIVPAVQGGAGTSINMNVNEIIANLALIKIGEKPGSYNLCDPIEQSNIFQSTNDVIPTALRVATIQLLEKLEEAINTLRSKIEEKEKSNRNAIRVGYTQMQEAVPSSFGLLFSSYADALSRDWWRVSKCFERIKVVNLGGGAIGTGMGAPRFFIMEVVPALQKLTGLPITRSENRMDATANLDTFVEIHATLKAHAVNLEKMVSDLRLLASDIASTGELTIPKRQVGSSIMPGKVNPVIPEYVVSVAHKVYANDQLISSLCGQGVLELNAYLPAIGHALLDSLKLLIAANQTLGNNLWDGLAVNAEAAAEKLFRSPSITTALTPYIGYHRAAELSKHMREKHCSIFEANEALRLFPEEQMAQLLAPDNLLKLGFSLKELGER